MGEAEDLLLKDFLAEVSEVERDNEVARILSCFKLNPFEHLNLPFDSAPDDVKKQYRKISLLVHPDKCKHPQAKEAFAALAKAQQLLLDQQEREYLLIQINSARDELRAKRKKQLKKDTASKLKSLVDENKLLWSCMHLPFPWDCRAVTLALRFHLMHMLFHIALFHQKCLSLSLSSFPVSMIIIQCNACQREWSFRMRLKTIDP
ncbi:dnaJ homolog subfamily C member 8 isoform X3 [Amborella trichopoda]|uniref:dnaJ homolog subfamily C member 8 isoform X3 n=1 Tax=Amborella trichopoda TaxID=13333 RepID=UPI0009BE1736|nr:dnaJ homolog subfamily C member 8 isoform X3 [Amborella trichopoda]|eukprot:XP_020519804.1 dnaJ homolog subfamily C member 8 isoform X3 [Amborella trichopoda]